MTLQASYHDLAAESILGAVRNGDEQDGSRGERSVTVAALMEWRGSSTRMKDDHEAEFV